MEERFEDALNQFQLARDSILSTCDLKKVINTGLCDQKGPTSTLKKHKIKTDLKALKISRHPVTNKMEDKCIDQVQAVLNQFVSDRFDEGFQTLNNTLEAEESLPYNHTT